MSVFQSSYTTDHSCLDYGTTLDNVGPFEASCISENLTTIRLSSPSATLAYKRVVILQQDPCLSATFDRPPAAGGMWVNYVIGSGVSARNINKSIIVTPDTCTSTVTISGHRFSSNGNTCTVGQTTDVWAHGWLDQSLEKLMVEETDTSLHGTTNVVYICIEATDGRLTQSTFTYTVNFFDCAQTVLDTPDWPNPVENWTINPAGRSI